MEPVPLRSCIDQLVSLNYSPIIGNRPHMDINKPSSHIPTISNRIKPRGESLTTLTNFSSPTN